MESRSGMTPPKLGQGEEADARLAPGTGGPVSPPGEMGRPPTADHPMSLEPHLSGAMFWARSSSPAPQNHQESDPHCSGNAWHG